MVFLLRERLKGSIALHYIKKVNFYLVKGGLQAGAQT